MEADDEATTRKQLLLLSWCQPSAYPSSCLVVCCAAGEGRALLGKCPALPRRVPVSEGVPWPTGGP